MLTIKQIHEITKYSALGTTRKLLARAGVRPVGGGGAGKKALYDITEKQVLEIIENKSKTAEEKRNSQIAAADALMAIFGLRRV